MTSGDLFTTWHTSTVDGLDHAVTDEVMAAGLGEQTEPIIAICGDLVLLTPMAAPPGSRCPRCVVFLRAHATLRDFGQREHRRPGWLSRLVQRTDPTVAGPDPHPRVRAGRHHHQGVIR